MRQWNRGHVALAASLAVVGSLACGNWAWAWRTIAPSKPDMVGVWQASAFLGSGWDDRYQFYDSGAYAYISSQMDCDSRILAEAGTYSVDGDRVVLTKKVEQVAVGGRLVPASGSCGSEMALIDFERRILLLDAPQTITLQVRDREAAEDDIYPSLFLNGKPFWKFNDSVYAPELIPYAGFDDKTCSRPVRPCMQ